MLRSVDIGGASARCLMSDHSDGFAMYWPKWKVTARFLRRMAFGLVAVAGLLWFVARIESINSQLGIDSSRATGLSAIARHSYSTLMLSKGVFSQASLAQPPVFPEGTRIARTVSLRVSVRDFAAARQSVD